MNADLLTWKREAVALTQMEQQQSIDGYGKKTCYIRIIQELWDAKGYGDLGLSSQSLHDQAAGLEKTQRTGEQGKFTMRCTDGGRGKFKILRWGKPVQGRTFR